MPGYEGRLELNWTNKAKRLLAAEDGSYEWVDPSDYRVAEVRLLEDLGTVGDVGQERAADNLLIRGDALNALRSLAHLPEFAKHYLGKIKLADVRNVYVIASMRSSVSEILTEQTLGRGMRLPFGAYTGIEILDTLEVVAHERYEELLRRAGVLNEAFVDYRTRAAVRLNAQGQQVVVLETVQAQSQPLIAIGSEADDAPSVADDQPDPVVTTVEDRTKQVGAAALAMRQQILPRSDAPRIAIPVADPRSVPGWARSEGPRNPVCSPRTCGCTARSHGRRGAASVHGEAVVP